MEIYSEQRDAIWLEPTPMNVNILISRPSIHPFSLTFPVQADERLEPIPAVMGAKRQGKSPICRRAKSF